MNDKKIKETDCITAVEKAAEATAQTLARLRKQAELSEQRVVPDSFITLALTKDGKVLATEVTENAFELFDSGYGAAREWEDIKCLCAMEAILAGLTKDGRVKIIKDRRKEPDEDDIRYIKDWKNVRELGCCFSQLYGLKEDGTLYSSYIHVKRDKDDVFLEDYWGQDRTEKMKNVEEVLLMFKRTICRDKDGALLATEYNTDVENDIVMWDEICGWKDIRQLYSLSRGILGVRKDGTLVASGVRDAYRDYDYWQEIKDWSGVTDFYEFDNGAVALNENGTILITEPLRTDSAERAEAIEEMKSWKTVVKLYDDFCTGRFLGLCADGTLLVSGVINRNYGDVREFDMETISEWNNLAGIVIRCGSKFGIRRDGTVLYSGDNSHGQGNVSDFKLFDRIEELG